MDRAVFVVPGDAETCCLNLTVNNGIAIQLENFSQLVTGGSGSLFRNAGKVNYNAG